MKKISRQANSEDQCTGHFWEGLYKSQALLDEKALAYVDLNLIHANMSKTPEKSNYTSVKTHAIKAKKASNPNHPNQQVKNLRPFSGTPRNDRPFGLPFKLSEYLELVELTGRVIRNDKRGHIENQQPEL